MRRFSSVVLFAALTLMAQEAHAADADVGARVFKAQCGTCHAVVAGRTITGPSMFGIVGRKVSADPAFHYSAASKAADFTWTEAKLDEYLANPRAAMPGTSMMFNGLKNDDQRADVVAYLATLK